MKGLEMLEYEIRYPRKCGGVTDETENHTPIRKVIHIHSLGYSIRCPICEWGMSTGGGKLDKNEVARLKKMYAESLAKSEIHQIEIFIPVKIREEQ